MFFLYPVVLPCLTLPFCVGFIDLGLLCGRFFCSLAVMAEVFGNILSKLSVESVARPGSVLKASLILRALV